MAFSQDRDRIAAPASADWSTPSGGVSPGQYHAVTLVNDGTLALCDGSTTFLGVLQDDPKLGQGGTVKFAQVTKAVAGGAVAIGDRVVPAAAITGPPAFTAGTFVTDTDATHSAVGIALTAASGAGVVFSMLLAHGVGVRA